MFSLDFQLKILSLSKIGNDGKRDLSAYFLFNKHLDSIYYVASTILNSL